MKLEYVREFTVLAENRNYMEAAELLYISQASLSRHIRELEGELGIPLFERTTRRVNLTSWGMLFLPYAKKILSAENEFREAVVHKKEQEANTLVIGSLTSGDAFGISGIISEFSKAFPDALINMMYGDTEDLLRNIKDNTCDFAFIRESLPSRNDDLKRIMITKDFLYVYLPWNHRLADREKVRIEDLMNEPFLMTEKTSLTSQLAFKVCEDAGFKPNVLLYGSKHQIFNYLNKGLGVSLLFKEVARKTDEYNTVIKTLEPKVGVYVNFIYNEKNDMNKIQCSFLEFMRRSIDTRTLHEPGSENV